MALNRLLSTTLLVGLFAGAAWLAQDAQANFAASPGFSGRGGATCLACHTEAPFPLTAPPATAVLEGLPAAWDLGQTYRLTIRVEGGPAALPAPAPQGGLDISIDGGVFSIPAEFEGLLFTPNAEEATYRPEGTLMREWQVDWTAPGLQTRPADRHVWLAVIAANGNHVVASNTSDGGERFDAAAHLTATVPPSATADAAWRALPLRAPEAAAEAGDVRTIVAGRHADANATRVAWSVDGAAWESRETGPEWRVRLDGLAAGSHTFNFRSEGADRISPEHSVRFDVPGFAVDLPGGKDTPMLGFVPLLLLFAVLVMLRSRTIP